MGGASCGRQFSKWSLSDREWKKVIREKGFVVTPVWCDVAGFVQIRRAVGWVGSGLKLKRYGAPFFSREDIRINLNLKYNKYMKQKYIITANTIYII